MVWFVGKLLHEQSEVIAGEPSFERGSRLLVVALEGGEAGLDLGEVSEVARGEDLSLDHREVDLDLVEPRGVDGELDELRVRPACREPFARSLAAVRRAVVNHPEHPACRGVGLAVHHLCDEAAEGLDSGREFAAPEHLGAMDVPGCKVLKGTATHVLELDALFSSRCSGQRLVTPDAAWMDVFSSEEMTKSLSPSGSPPHSRA